MTSLPDSSSAELSEAEGLVRAGSFGAAVEILLKIVEQEADPQATFMLASSYLELGQYDEAFRHASAAVESEPSSAPARDLLAKVNLALGDYASALSDYDTLAALCREQRPAPPELYSIPAHFALRNLEQLDHILTENRDKQSSAGALTENILMAYAAASQTLSTGRMAKRLGCPSMEEVLGFSPTRRSSRFRRKGCRCYLNPDVDYQPIQRALVGRLKAEVIDDFLDPEALEQVRKFCLESTVWRHPYRFGYVGRLSAGRIRQHLAVRHSRRVRAALGEAFDEYQLAQWWAFVYDTRLPGTDIHGDDADFSLNFWITPDSANLDPDGAALLFGTRRRRATGAYDDYNSGGERVRQYLEDAQRRIDSHSLPGEPGSLVRGTPLPRTDDFTFAPGFENRRRSVTLLFRRRKR